MFGTANGYWRVNPKLDIYHFALIDLVSSYGAQLTNLTGGINYKPTQRLRMTASYNRVDTETLNIQAGAYLDTTGTNQTGQQRDVRRAARDERERVAASRRARRPRALRGHRRRGISLASRRSR